jgi:hypothetical protein
MIEVQKPESGHSMAVLFPGQPLEKTQVIGRTGQYITLENGLRFHFLDDKIGEKTWQIDGAVIQWL